MDNIQVHRYAKPAAGFVGYIEPADRHWILFVPVEGEPVLFPKRGPSGAVID